MKNVQYLINQVRKQTENEEFTDFTGIQDSEFIQYINDAQHSLQAAIVSQHPRVFTKEVVLDIVNGQESYSLPSDCYLGNKIHNVEYSQSGSEEDYYPLDQDIIKSRISGIEGSPMKYIRMSGKIIILPQPMSGKLRITYVRRVPELDLRRALVSSATSTAINLDNAAFLTDHESISEHDTVCVVDRKGNIIASDIPFSAVSSTVIELDNYTPSSSDLSIEAGHFVVGGSNTSTHGEFDSSVERYIIAYAAWKILKRDSSVDSVEAMQELSMMLGDIVKSYGMVSDDVQYVPDLHTWDDWSF
jgi:hypothetical protein